MVIYEGNLLFRTLLVSEVCSISGKSSRLSILNLLNKISGDEECAEKICASHIFLQPTSNYLSSLIK